MTAVYNTTRTPQGGQQGESRGGRTHNQFHLVLAIARCRIVSGKA
jgi:hypothetical protein